MRNKEIDRARVANMVSTVEDAAARRQGSMSPSKTSLKRSLPPPSSLAMSNALPDEIPLDCLKTVLPPLVNGPNSVGNDHEVVGRDNKNFVLGKNMHGSSLEITEPDHDDEVTGEKDAYMAGVLARYRKSLTEKTKYHLGAQTLTDFLQRSHLSFVVPRESDNSQF